MNCKYFDLFKSPTRICKPFHETIYDFIAIQHDNDRKIFYKKEQSERKTGLSDVTQCRNTTTFSRGIV